MARRVLVVDNDRKLNDLVRERLLAEGFECLQAFDGAEAKSIFDSAAPDALVLDLGLPGTADGVDVLRYVKERCPFTPVHILSDNLTEQKSAHALSFGADGVYAKPLVGDELVAGLARNIAHSRHEREVAKRHHWPGEDVDHWMGRLFLNAPAALIHVDPDNTIRAVNRAAASLLGNRPESIIGKNILEIVGTQVTRQWLDVVRTEAATPQGYEGELHLRRGARATFPAAITSVERPEPGHLLLSIRDLTRQKRLEEQLLQSKHLASLGKVVEGVAHEVRNPLIAIGGFARKIKREIAEDSPHSQYLEIILKEVVRLEAMVHDIEQYVSFASTNPQTFRAEDLGDIVSEAFRAAKDNIENAELITATLTIPEGTPNVFGDRDLMLELFDALLENAYHAMPEGGRLNVEVGFVEGWVRVIVADTGVGIETELVEEVFDPFFTSKTAGAGLGLAKAYMICEDHGGHIYLDSKIGEGTTCTVILPIDRRQVERA